jgi:hypothetical protein
MIAQLLMRQIVLGTGTIVAVLAGCEKGGPRGQATAGTVRADTTPVIVPERCATLRTPWTEFVTPITLRSKPALPDTNRRDSAVAVAIDTTRPPLGAPPATSRRDSVRSPRVRRDSALHVGAGVAARDTFPTPPAPLPGSVLPGCRIVAFYGNPLSNRMGIMGSLPPDKMLAKLDSQAHTFEVADTATPVIRALELITPVAQGSPGPKGLWRQRMADTLIDRIARLAEAHSHLFILDVQVGKSTVATELEPLVQFLKRPYVHLALDPEFSMKGSEPPGKKIGTMDAADVNVAIDLLARLVDENHLPPKVLIVHRFTQRMLTNHEKIRRDPRVQVVINMDGFGPPSLKLGSYQAYVYDRPVQYYGIKLFYKNDKPLFSASDVLRLNPIPQYIQYQ